MTASTGPIAAETVRELYCGGCGYGIVVRRADPPPCPMCQANAWAVRPVSGRWN